MTVRKIALVTGASRGIGAATARLAAERGWSVLTSYLERREPAEAVVREIEAAGGRAATIQADTSREEDVRRIFDAAEAQFGPVTGLVNNAGMNGGPSSFADTPVAELRRLIDINVIGAMLCAREALRRMGTDRGGQGGAIVNLGSVAARLGSPGERVHYSASKGAILSFTQGLGREAIKQGVRVNCISPGLTETEMNPPGRLARLLPVVPIGRVAEPVEIARAILFLLSPEASYITGTELTVSGGR
jgi:NAD(P)-dependent dehydrogenase (short-subunit alcohol dehydrogenase family)